MVAITVDELAAELGRTPSAVLAAAEELGHPLTGGASTVPADLAARLRSYLGKTPPPDPARGRQTPKTPVADDPALRLEPTLVAAAAPTEDSLSNRVLVGVRGQYRLTDKLSRGAAGGFGSVWTAIHEDAEGGRRLVAVKILTREVGPDATRREFERSRDRGPHVVLGIDHSPPDAVTPFVVMEYVPGLRLEDVVLLGSGEVAPLPFDELRLLCQALASALQHLYEKAGPRRERSYHGDLQPRNVLRVVERGRPRYVVVDLGLGHHDDSHTGETVRWARYRAPEMYPAITAMPPHRIYTDVHMAAQVILFALTGDDPTGSGTDSRRDFATLPALIPEKTPGDLRDLLVAMLTVDANERADLVPIDELPAALEHALDERPTPPPPPPRTRGPGRRITLAVAAVLATVAAGVAAAHYYPGDGSDVDAGSEVGPSKTVDPLDASPSDVSTQTVVAPDAPPAPAVTARPAYRAVVFSVIHDAAPSGIDYRLEHREDDAWSTVDDTTTTSTAGDVKHIEKLTTSQGGDRACARFRVVAVTDGGETPGPSSRVCERARPRTVRLVNTHDSCSLEGHACTWYDVVVAGFESGTAPIARVLKEGEPWCKEAGQACKFYRVRIGSDGRGEQHHEWRIVRGSVEADVVLNVDGVTAKVYVP